ncbi:MAG: TPM domain-containing protein [Granulosicoccaceae bacterium]
MTSFLTQADQDAISAAIAEQERRTLAELVTVVTDASDNYRYIPVLWAAIISMIIPGLVFILGGWQDFSSLYSMQVLLFVALAVGFRVSPIKYMLIPKAIKHQRAARMARQQFFAQRLHHTEQRLGVLLFVSVAEHYVEILADTGASEKISDQQWAEIVDDFSSKVAAEQVVQGFLQAIGRCGDLLAEVAPQDASPVDALPNNLVILKADDSRSLL